MAARNRAALLRHARNVRLWWSTLAAIVAALETWAVLHPEREATLSHLTRAACRTHTPIGRVAFAASWLWFAAWFPRHILRGVHMTAPVTTANIPTPLKQGAYKATPAKQHPMHKQAEADAAACTKAARGK